MSVDVHLIRNAHVLSACSADSDLLIFGSDTSELLIIVTIVITYVPLYNISVNISITTLNLRFTKHELN